MKKTFMTALGVLVAVSMCVPAAYARSSRYDDEEDSGKSALSSALMGGLLGAGLGAAIGSGSGKAGQGAAIGAGVGAIGGTLVGAEKSRAAKAEQEREYYESEDPATITVAQTAAENPASPVVKKKIIREYDSDGKIVKEEEVIE